MSKIQPQTLERELSARQSNLQQLQATLDEAVDAGNSPEVVRLQAEVGAAQMLLDSTLRRIDRAKAGASAEEKAARIKANADRVALVAKSLQGDIGLVAKIESTVEQLVEQLAALRTHGEAAGSAVNELINQLPERKRGNFYNLIRDAGNTDTRIAVLIESLLQERGVFDTLAPHPSLVLIRRNLPSLRDDYAARAERLADAVAKLSKFVGEVGE